MVSLKVPSVPVTVPREEPFGKTETPLMGVPSFASVTLPEIFLPWENNNAGHSSNMGMSIPASSRFVVIRNRYLD
jgi:hypothetical protein